MSRTSPNQSFSFVGKLWFLSALSLGAFILLLLPAVIHREDPSRLDKQSELDKIATKYYPDYTGNWTRKQILDALNMELDVLTFEESRLYLDIQRQKSRSMRRRIPARPPNGSSSKLVRNTFVPTIRNLRKNFRELFGMAKGAAIELTSVTEDASKLTSYEFQERRKHVDKINRLLVKELEKLGAPFSQWRKVQAEAMADEIHQRFQGIQNPVICDPARMILCDAFTSTKLDTILQKVVDCSTVSFAANKTMVFPSYRQQDPSRTFDWTKYLLPPSPQCQRTQQETIQTVKPSNRPLTNPLLEPTIPRNYVDLIGEFHPDPGTWWTGQTLPNMWVVRPDLQEELSKALEETEFRLPVVGLHIQRSAKDGTSNSESVVLAEYMAMVEEHYQRLEPSTDLNQKRLYVISDIPVIYAELRLRYPQYTMLSSRDIVPRLAGKHSSPNEGFLKSVVDMWFLERTSHLVCATTSTICRMAHAVLQTKFFDAKSRLDVVNL